MTVPAPKLLATSVIRGTQKGDSHGGIYLIDFEKNVSIQKMDWNHCEIDFSGRGADRGLRGIAYYNDRIYIAASDEIFVFDQAFNIVTSFRNPFLKHCHEICIHKDTLYLTSTAYDSILIYDLISNTFSAAVYIKFSNNQLRVQSYNPQTPRGPTPCNTLHINSVFCDDSGLYFSGRKSPYLYFIRQGKFGSVGKIPFGTHNARPFENGLLYNDTEQNRLCLQRDHTLSSPVPEYPLEAIKDMDKYESKIARPFFGRGLCVISKRYVAAGSSPSTVALHDLDVGSVKKCVNISMDVRNAIHGLELWPF